MRQQFPHSHLNNMAIVFNVIVTIVILIFKSDMVSAGKRQTTFFIFGDSSVDPGNNNYIDTIPENQANYKPYGQNGIFKDSTGRFSDGRIIVDFISEYANLPIIPPFLDPSADYIHGVNFASGGAGILSSTNHGQAIDLKTQLKYFEVVREWLTGKLGNSKADEVISSAVYFFSIGSNDYLGGYLGNPRMQQLHHPEEYLGMVIGNLTQAIQELYAKGARKFGFLSLSPLGCLPVLRALDPEANGGCLEQANFMALAHNNALKSVLSNFDHLLKGFKYSNSNFFDWLQDRINNPSNYGFKEGVNACCGTGPYGGLFTCGGTKKVTAAYELCDNADEYVWWDSFHPTEKIHLQFAEAIWSGPRPVVGPFNLRDLFFDEVDTTIADLVDDTLENKLYFFM